MITPEGLLEAADHEDTPPQIGNLLREAAAEIQQLRAVIGAASGGASFRDLYRRRDSTLNHIEEAEIKHGGE